MARELIYHAKSSLLLRAACHLMLGRSWVSSMMSEWERVSWLINCVLCVFGGWCTGDGKGSAPFGFKYFQPWPNMESVLCQHLNVFFLGRFSRKPKNNGVGNLSLLQCIFRPRNQTRVSCIESGFFINWVIREAQIGIVILEKYSLIGGIKCEWVKGLPDVIRICICQGKTKNPSLSLHRWLSWLWGVFLAGRTYLWVMPWGFLPWFACPSGYQQVWSLQSHRLCHWGLRRGPLGFPGWQDLLLLVLQEGFHSGHLD